MSRPHIRVPSIASHWTDRQFEYAVAIDLLQEELERVLPGANLTKKAIEDVIRILQDWLENPPG